MLPFSARTATLWSRNRSPPCRKVHGHLDRRTWNYESFRLRIPHPFRLPDCYCRRAHRQTLPKCFALSLRRNARNAHFLHPSLALPMIDKQSHHYHSLFFPSTTSDPGPCRPPSTHSHISLNSPRKNPVMNTDRMHAGLRQSSSR